jgi:hypothetical protein
LFIRSLPIGGWGSEMGEGQAQGKAFPDGLAEPHVAGNPVRDRVASLIPLVLLTILLGTAMTGMLGGRPSPTSRVDAPAASLSIKTPRTLRNGMFFETEISATPHRAFKDLTIAVDRTLWKDLTVNTMVPAAADETFEDGRYRFSYGAGEAGKAVVMKIDSQINPSLVGGTAGRVAVFDGDLLIAELPVTMKVRP